MLSSWPLQATSAEPGTSWNPSEQLCSGLGGFVCMLHGEKDCTALISTKCGTTFFFSILFFLFLSKPPLWRCAATHRRLPAATCEQGKLPSCKPWEKPSSEHWGTNASWAWIGNKGGPSCDAPYDSSTYPRRPAAQSYLQCAKRACESVRCTCQTIGLLCLDLCKCVNCQNVGGELDDAGPDLLCGLSDSDIDRD